MENTQDRQAIGQGKNIVIKTPIMSFQAAVYAVCCIPFDAFRSITSRASSPTEAEPLLPPNLAISTTDQTSSTILTINQPSPNPALSPRTERTENPKTAPIKYRRPIRNRDLTLKQWLRPVDFKSQMTVFEEDYVPTAQVWIANIVYEWAVLPDDAPIMWINGGGKSGKTYSCYSVVRHLPEELILGCAYFTRYDDLRTTEPESVIRTLVWQLFERLPAFKAYVESIMSQDLAPSNKVSLLEDPVNAFTLLVVNGLNEIPVPEHNVLIVIDALDELSVKTRKVLWEIIDKQCPNLPSYVKLLVTGRPEVDIYNCFTKAGAFEFSVHDQTEYLQQEDMRKVLQHYMKKIWHVQELTATMKELETVVLEKAFLFASIRIYTQVFQDGGYTPESALALIKSEEFEANGGIYPVVVNYGLQQTWNSPISLYKQVVGTILAAKEPLDYNTLGILGAVSLGTFAFLACQLKPLIRLQHHENSTNTLTIHHKLIRDHLVLPYHNPGPNMFINIRQQNYQFATSCLDILSVHLETIPRRSFLMPRVLVDWLHGVDCNEIPGCNAHTEYARKYWVKHLDLEWAVPPNFQDFAEKYKGFVGIYLEEVGEDGVLEKMKGFGVDV